MPSKDTCTNVNNNIICKSCSWKPLKCPLTIEGKINCGLAPPWVLWSKENERFIAACEWIDRHMLSNKIQAQKGASYSTPPIENLKNRYFVFYQKLLICAERIQGGGDDVGGWAEENVTSLHAGAPCAYALVVSSEWHTHSHYMCTCRTLHIFCVRHILIRSRK